MNKDNVLISSDVIEECLSECFDVFEKHAYKHTSDKPSEVKETAS